MPPFLTSEDIVLYYTLWLLFINFFIFSFSLSLAEEHKVEVFESVLLTSKKGIKILVTPL